MHQRLELLRERTEELFSCLGVEPLREEQVLVDKDAAAEDEHEHEMHHLQQDLFH